MSIRRFALRRCINSIRQKVQKYLLQLDGITGLAVSKSILQNVGGRLWAENNRGPGATFYITVPMPAKPAAISATRQTHEPGPNVLQKWCPVIPSSCNRFS